MDRDHYPEEAAGKPIRVLLVTTKFPWPPLDGGRLLVAKTLQALDPKEVKITIAGPWSTAPADGGMPPSISRLEPVAPKPHPFGRMVLLARNLWELALATSRVGGLPATAIKHRNPMLKQRLRELLEREEFDVIHVEQPHAMESIPPTAVPLLLRAQNVEADLWRRYAANATGLLTAFVLGGQACAVERWERSVVKRAAFIAAISEEDRESLRSRTSPEQRAHVRFLPPAFPSRIKQSTASAERLPGEPPVVVFAGSSWRPNRLGEREFLQEYWPQMSRRVPASILHVFAPRPLPEIETESRRVRIHSPPTDAGEALVAGSVLAVPATVTSGVRMKIIEAFARGLCVVTTPAGARGLGPQLREAVRVADHPEAWGEHLAWLNETDNFTHTLAIGRRALQHEHDPDSVSAALIDLYRRCQKRGPGDGHGNVDLPTA